MLLAAISASAELKVGTWKLDEASIDKLVTVAGVCNCGG